MKDTLIMLKYINWISMIFLMVTIIALIKFFFLALIRKKEPNRRAIIYVIVTLLFSEIDDSFRKKAIIKAQNYIRESIEQFEKSEGDFFIGNKESKKVNIYLNEIKKVKKIKAHHSYPEDTILIELIFEEKKLKLELGRDSTYEREYWVFLPDYYYFNLNEVGRIKTDVFDKF